VKIVHGTEIAAAMVGMVEEAEQVLVLISPYFDPWEHLSAAIKNAAVGRRVSTTLVVRGGDDRDKQAKHAEPFREYSVTVAYLSRLHAKIYFNEKRAFITSLNLLKSSALGSWEVGVMLDREADRLGYEEVLLSAKNIFDLTAQEAKREKTVARNKAMTSILEGAGQLAGTLAEQWIEGKASGGQTAPRRRATKSAGSKVKKPRGRKPASSKKGTCIRCGDSLKLNPARPLCRSCYVKWAEYENPDYKEKFCHQCGKSHRSSVAKPVCRSCWSK